MSDLRDGTSLPARPRVTVSPAGAGYGHGLAESRYAYRVGLLTRAEHLENVRLARFVILATEPRPRAAR